MKVALSWLKKYLDLPETVEELSTLLTFAGIEVEAISEIPRLDETVICARVISAEPVPKTDHLKLCAVDIGDREYPEKDENNCIAVICGAPNCHAGMMAVLAMPGSILGELEIKQAKIRGIISNGMLCSERELGISENHAGIIELPEDVAIGSSVNELYALPDTVFELEITPNRSDLLGYLGIARDLCAKLTRDLKEPAIKAFELGSTSLKLGLVNQEPELCPRYTARVFQNVRVGESPLWLKTALIKSGLRPINNIVDITNFVMLETGHPLHAFDYDKLAATNPDQAYPDIVIRKAHPKEEILALDGRTYTLEGDELVIADGQKASALAGVMGSEFSGISAETTKIVLESAAFHPGSIRKTSYRLKLSTDSSYRFERHLAAEYADSVSARATNLIVELAGAELCGELYDSYPARETDKYLGLRPSRFAKLIGFELRDAEITDYLGRLGFSFMQYGNHRPGVISDLSKVYCHHGEEMKQGKTEFTELADCDHSHYYKVPPYRKDVSREADLIEELARLAGYDKVPQKTAPQLIMDRHAYRIRKKVMDWMVSWGCFETLNYSFCDPRQMQDLGYEPEQLPLISLMNPQSTNQSAMRVSLVPQILTNLAYNLNHAQRDVKLFEQSRVYHKTADGHIEPMHLAAVFTGSQEPEHWQNKPEPIDFIWAKGCFEGLLAQLNLEYDIKLSVHPYHIGGEAFSFYAGKTELGSIGRVKPQVLAKWGIDSSILKQDVWMLESNVDAVVEQTRNQSIKFKEISRYPAVIRDLSFLAPLCLRYEEIRTTIIGLNKDLVRDVQLFDEYRSEQIPEGFRSLSLRIVLQDQEKTLTDERALQLMNSVQKTLFEKYEIRMR
jgi:phenylalanyl-tRNA synthetase beta chain